MKWGFKRLAVSALAVLSAACAFAASSDGWSDAGAYCSVTFSDVSPGLSFTVMISYGGGWHTAYGDYLETDSSSAVSDQLFYSVEAGGYSFAGSGAAHSYSFGDDDQITWVKLTNSSSNWEYYTADVVTYAFTGSYSSYVTAADSAGADANLSEIGWGESQETDVTTAVTKRYGSHESLDNFDLFGNDQRWETWYPVTFPDEISYSYEDDETHTYGLGPDQSMILVLFAGESHSSAVTAPAPAAAFAFAVGCLRSRRKSCHSSRE
jgi:hypothetical protein